MRRRLRLALGLAATVALIAPPIAAEAVERPFSLGFTDPLYNSSDHAARAESLDGAAAVGAGYARIGVGWAGIASQRPADPTDPADSAYRFGALDRVLIEAADRDLTPLLTVQSAPPWAEGPNRPGWANVGAWKPDPHDLGAFAAALATRYGGGYPNPDDPSRALPRVRYFEVWNEINLSTYLAPQSIGGELYAPRHYRRMVNEFYRAAHAAQPGVSVIAGALSPLGDGSPSFIDGEPVQPSPWGPRTHPMTFLREMLCLDDQLEAKPCTAKARFDILSDHPISQGSGPRTQAPHPDDIAIADLREVKQTLRTAENLRQVVGGGRRPLWVTEYWWQTRPPRTQAAYPTLGQQARWIAEAQMSFWELDIPVATMYSLRDQPYVPGGRTFQAGLYFEDGSAKPSLAAALFPLAARRRCVDDVYVWTRPPSSGALSVQRLVGGQWQTLSTLSVSAGVPVAVTVPMQGSGSLRAVVGGESSYVYAQSN